MKSIKKLTRRFKMSDRDIFRISLIICILFLLPGLLVSSDTEKITNRTAAELYPIDSFISKKIEEPFLNADEFRGTKIILTQEDIDNLPANFSWYKKGIMTSVKDQQTCGSCWAFSAIGVFEALIKKSDGIEVDLSEQQLVNCFADGKGCWGADSFLAAVYMVENGIVREGVYPYKNDQWECDLTESSEFYLDAARYLPMDAAESKLERRQKTKYLIMNYGPIDTRMIAYEDFWFYYSSGVYIYDGVSKVRTGHAVVILGWVDDDSISTGGYWLVKNSFGETWGENGYFRAAYEPEEHNVIGFDPIRYSVYNGMGNDPPYFDDISYEFDGYEGSELSFTAAVVDPDGDKLTYSGLNLPQGMNVGSATGTVTWTPNYTQAGSYTITITVTDGAYTIRTPVSVNIINVKKIKY
jgi:C1A family cysteine protease